MADLIICDTHSEYLERTDLISSGMVKLGHQKTPLHVWDAYLNPEREDDSSDAMDWGRALHEKFLLGDATFDDKFAVGPVVDKRTKQGKADWAAFEKANEGKTLLRPSEDYDQMERMIKSLRSNDHVTALLAGTERELSVYHEDCKCRFDAVGGDQEVAIDLKTISEITPHKISTAIYNYGYYIQAAWYLTLAEQAGMDIDYGAFVFIFVESKPPYDVAIRALSADAIELGRKVITEQYPILRHCMDANDWPGFGAEGIKAAELPLYAYTSD